MSTCDRRAGRGRGLTKNDKRVGHYRGLANGTTVVQFLGSKANAGGQLLKRIAEFRKAVDDALPGRYCWFRDGT